MVIAMRPWKGTRAADGKVLSRLEWPKVVVGARRLGPAHEQLRKTWLFFTSET